MIKSMQKTINLRLICFPFPWMMISGRAMSDPAVSPLWRELSHHPPTQRNMQMKDDSKADDEKKKKEISTKRRESVSWKNLLHLFFCFSSAFFILAKNKRSGGNPSLFLSLSGPPQCVWLRLDICSRWSLMCVIHSHLNLKLDLHKLGCCENWLVQNDCLHFATMLHHPWSEVAEKSWLLELWSSHCWCYTY